eukprot:192659_1
MPDDRGFTPVISDDEGALLGPLQLQVEHVRMSKRRRFLYVAGIAFVVVGSLALIIGLAAHKSANNPDSETVWTNLRLPVRMVPTHYQMTLRANLTTEEFGGSMAIDLTVTEATSYVVLHSVDLNITQAAVKCGGKAIDVTSVTFNSTLQLCYIHCSSMLPPGHCTVTMGFSGKLLNQLDGLYLSTYQSEKDGKTTEHKMATTQFEPVSARKAFPCFDEPGMKANFSVTLIGEVGQTILFNTAPASPQPTHSSSGLQEVLFETTPRMSTYLVAMIFSNFESTDPVKTKQGVPIRVWTEPGYKSQGVFARDVTQKVLDHYADIFGIPFALKKCDLIAIPDFSAGAMENWGLITFRKADLLIDLAQSGSVEQERVAIVVAHELAHQWFGDLVTMKWWNDLFLNEGFAAWMEFEGTTAAYPEWNVREKFFVDNTLAALELDSLETSHPIEAEVSNPLQIGQLFDKISYNKGAASLEMISRYMGPTETSTYGKFFKGLAQYISQHQYGNAESTDLWNALGKQSSADIPAIMKSWVLKKGYPVISLTLNSDKTRLTISQKQFYSSNATATPDNLWWLLLNYRSNLAPEIVSVDMGEQQSMTVSYPTGATWFKMNMGQAGFYRVNYPEEMWAGLETALSTNNSIISPVDRAGLLNDKLAFALATHNITLPVHALQFAQKVLRAESSYTPWAVALDQIGTMANMFVFEECFGAFHSFMQSLMRNQVAALGWDSRPTDSHLTKLTRRLLLETAVGINLDTTLDVARTRFTNWVTNSTANPIDPDIRAAVYIGAVKMASGSDVFDTLWKRAINSSTLPTEKNIIFRALSTSRQTYQLQFLLDQSLHGAIRSQDAASVVGMVAMNPAGVYLAWNFVKVNAAELTKEHFASSRIIGSVTRRFTNTEMIGEVRGVFGANGGAYLEQAIEGIQIRSDWLAVHRNDVCSFLHTQQNLNL